MKGMFFMFQVARFFTRRQATIRELWVKFQQTGSVGAPKRRVTTRVDLVSLAQLISTCSRDWKAKRVCTQRPSIGTESLEDFQIVFP